MTMMPRLRSLVLTAHITSSVGLLGAVAAFLALAIAGLASQEPQTVRASYLAMDLIMRFVVIPLFGAALLVGMAQSLVSSFGLFQHYWVLVKLLLTLVSIAVLFVHLRLVDRLADAALRTTLSATDLFGMRIQVVVAAAAALVVLLAATVLSVYKPRGMTLYGWRKQRMREFMPR